MLASILVFCDPPYKQFNHHWESIWFVVSREEPCVFRITGINHDDNIYDPTNMLIKSVWHFTPISTNEFGEITYILKP